MATADSPPVTLELLRTVGKKLKNSLPSPHVHSIGPSRTAISTKASLSDVFMSTLQDLSNLLQLHEPPQDWKKSIAMLRQKPAQKPFMEYKDYHYLEETIRQRETVDVAAFKVSDAPPPVVSIPSLQPSLLTRLTGSLSPQDYSKLSSKALVRTAKDINTTINESVKGALYLANKLDPDSIKRQYNSIGGKPQVLERLSGFSKQCTSSASTIQNVGDTDYDSSRAVRTLKERKAGATVQYMPRSHTHLDYTLPKMTHITSKSSDMGPMRMQAESEDLLGADAEEYSVRDTQNSNMTHKPVINAVKQSNTSRSPALTRKNLIGALPQIAGSAERIQIEEDLKKSEKIAPRDMTPIAKKRHANEEVTGLDSFMSWRHKIKRQEGAVFVTEALKINETSASFFPTMLSEMTANYSNDLRNNIDKTCY